MLEECLPIETILSYVARKCAQAYTPTKYRLMFILKITCGL